MMISRRAPESAIVVFVALAALTAALTLVAIERSPLVWSDETYIASAAYSVTLGDGGVPTVLPPGSWNRPFSKVYGPFFFKLGALAIDLFGIRPIAVRMVSLAGALMLAGSAALLVRAFGGTPLWAWLAAAIMWVTPEIGSSATNGRMDTLAVGLELLGLALSALAVVDPRRRRRILLTIAAGIAWTCGALCTPRTYPFLAAVAVISLFGWLRRGPQRRIALVWTVALSHVAIGLVCWLVVEGITPRDWLGLLLTSATKDQFNGTLSTTGRVWAISGKTALIPVVALVALAGVWTLGVRRSAARSMPIVAATVSVTVMHAVLYALVFNYTFFGGMYFSLPLLASAVAASASDDLTGARRIALVACWLAVGTVCLVFRTVKLVEVFDTWEARDPAPLEQFVKGHVPAGSLVFGSDAFYFYAVTRSGSVFRTSTAEPYPGSPTIGRRPHGVPSSNDRLRHGVLASERYLLWPVDETTFAFPEDFSCARAGAVARFEPAASSSTVVTRLPLFAAFAYLHTYPATLLYRLPDSCRPQ
jgi:hypothetical protein